MTTMITFNELRQIKDMLPSGSMQKIADELGLDVETVRNYFGGDHYDEGKAVGLHIEQNTSHKTSQSCPIKQDRLQNENI